MKLLFVTLFLATSAFANDSLEQTYSGVTDTGETCTVRLRDSEGSASFTYHDGGDRRSCGLSYDRYYLTNMRDDGRTFATVSDKSGFKSCKVQVYFGAQGELTRLRMGLKSIFNPFHIYKDCKLN